MADKNITVTNDVITRATAIKKESAEFEKNKAARPSYTRPGPSGLGPFSICKIIV